MVPKNVFWSLWFPHYDQKTGDTKFEGFYNQLPTTTSYLVPDFDTNRLGRSYKLDFHIICTSQPREPCLKALKRKLGSGPSQYYIRDSNDDNNVDHGVLV